MCKGYEKKMRYNGMILIPSLSFVSMPWLPEESLKVFATFFGIRTARLLPYFVKVISFAFLSSRYFAAKSLS